jgi:hypothetical protein
MLALSTVGEATGIGVSSADEENREVGDMVVIDWIEGAIAGGYNMDRDMVVVRIKDVWIEAEL